MTIKFLRKEGILLLSLLASVYSVDSRQLRRKPVDQGQWDALNVTVEGRLMEGEPFAKACFPVSGPVVEAFSSPACLVIRDNYLNESEHDLPLLA